MTLLVILNIIQKICWVCGINHRYNHLRTLDFHLWHKKFWSKHYQYKYNRVLLGSSIQHFSLSNFERIASSFPITWWHQHYWHKHLRNLYPWYKNSQYRHLGRNKLLDHSKKMFSKSSPWRNLLPSTKLSPLSKSWVIYKKVKFTMTKTSTLYWHSCLQYNGYTMLIGTFTFKHLASRFHY